MIDTDQCQYIKQKITSKPLVLHLCKETQGEATGYFKC